MNSVSYRVYPTFSHRNAQSEARMYEDMVVSLVFVLFLHKCFSQCLWKLIEMLCASFNYKIYKDVLHFCNLKFFQKLHDQRCL